MIEVDIQFSKAEFIRSRRLILLKTNFRWFDPLVCLALLGYGGYKIALGNPQWFEILFVVIALFYFAVTAITLFVMPAIMYEREEKNRVLYKVVCSSEQVVYESKFGRQELQWDFYKKAIRTDEFYFLIYGYQAVNAIPRRVFTDEAQIERFEAMVRERIKDSFK